MIPAPEFIWRLTKYRDLSGRGGLEASGRWHTRPKPIVYCSELPSTAYSEIVSQTGSDWSIPDAVAALKIRVPTNAAALCVEENQLDPRWDDPSLGWVHCQPVGNRWLLDSASPLLRVPCAVVRGTFNYLINPVHRAADYIEIVEVIEQPFPDFIRSAA